MLCRRSPRFLLSHGEDRERLSQGSQSKLKPKIGRSGQGEEGVCVLMCTHGGI